MKRKELSQAELALRDSDFVRQAGVGDVSALRRLFKDGVKVDASDGWWTALCIASGAGRNKAVRWLLDNGADVNLAMRQGDVPAMWAALGGRPDCLALLVNGGSDLTFVNPAGQTVLMRELQTRAVDSQDCLADRERCIEIAFEARCDFSAVNRKGQRAEDIARDKGWPHWSERIRVERERQELGAVLACGATSGRGGFRV